MSTDSYNFCLYGAMGSGKSVLAQLIILSILSTNGLVIAVDKGESYSDFCKTIGGQLINAANLYLNAFSNLDMQKLQADEDLLPQEIEAFFHNQISMITDLYLMMGKPKDQDSVSDIERSFVKRSIYKAFEQKGTKTLVDDVIAEMKSIIQQEQQEELGLDRRKSDWIELLSPYATYGSNPHVFNQPSNFSSNAFICIETEGVPSDIKNALMMALIIDVENKFILGKKDRQKLFLIEEAGALLKHINSKALEYKFAEGAATYRKKNAALGIVNQTQEEMFKTELLKIIDQKAAQKIIMRQPTGYSAFAEASKVLPKEQAQKVERFFEASKAHFSTFLLQIGGQYSVHYAFMDPFTKVLTTTQASETATINNYVKALRKEGLSEDNALAKALEKTMWDFYGDEAQALIEFSKKFENQY